MLVLKGPTSIVVKVALFLFNLTLTCLPYCTLQADITTSVSDSDVVFMDSTSALMYAVIV